MPDGAPILDYAAPTVKKSIVPKLGILLCSAGALWAVAIFAFGIWWIVMTGVAEIFRGAGICVLGALLFYLCARWRRDAIRSSI